MFPEVKLTTSCHVPGDGKSELLRVRVAQDEVLALGEVEVSL